MLPDPVQDTVATAVETVTPLDLEGGDDDRPGRDGTGADAGAVPAATATTTAPAEPTEAAPTEGAFDVELWHDGPVDGESFGSWVSEGAHNKAAIEAAAALRGEEGFRFGHLVRAFASAKHVDIADVEVDGVELEELIEATPTTAPEATQQTTAPAQETATATTGRGNGNASGAGQRQQRERQRRERRPGQLEGQRPQLTRRGGGRPAPVTARWSRARTTGEPTMSAGGGAGDGERGRWDPTAVRTPPWPTSPIAPRAPGAGASPTSSDRTSSTGRDQPVLLVESQAVFRRRRFHRQKAHLVLSALRHRAAELGDQADFHQVEHLRRGARPRCASRSSVCAPTSWRSRDFVLARPGVQVLAAARLRHAPGPTSRPGPTGAAGSGCCMEDFYRDARRPARRAHGRRASRSAGGGTSTTDNREPPPADGRLAAPAPWWPEEDEIDAEVRADLDRWEADGDRVLRRRRRPAAVPGHPRARRCAGCDDFLDAPARRLRPVRGRDAAPATRGWRTRCCRRR